MKALDVAFSRISPAWAHDRLMEGWGLLIQDVWTGGYANNDGLRANAEANLRDWRIAGGRTAIYSNAAPWRTPQLWFDESMLNAGAEFQHCAGVVIDYEIAAGNERIADADMVTFIALWEQTGMPVGLYSGDWFTGMMDAQGYRINYGLPYWYARYDNVAVVNPNEVIYPMGPVKAKQYGGGQIAGVTVDYNVFNDDFFGASQPQQPTEDDVYVRFDDPATPGAPGYEAAAFWTNGAELVAIYDGDLIPGYPASVKVLTKGTPEYAKYQALPTRFGKGNPVA